MTSIELTTVFTAGAAWLAARDGRKLSAEEREGLVTEICAIQAEMDSRKTPVLDAIARRWRGRHLRAV